jgi:hypothetical protein
MSIAELAHELTHVWQYEQRGFLSYTWAAITQRSYQVPARVPADRSFSSYGIEQQATLVELCYLGRSDACRVIPFR